MFKNLRRCALLVVLSGLMTVPLQADSDRRRRDRDDDDNTRVRVQLLWLLDGIRNTYEAEIPPTDLGTTVAGCHDHEIIDLRSNRIIGNAVDCTADFIPIGAEGGAIATGTTFFHLPEGNITIRNTGSIQPMLSGDPQFRGSPVTHIAGIFPDPGQNNVIEGTGIFKGATGTFALLGGLDLTNAADGQSRYHCVYFFDLELDKRAVRKCKNPKLFHRSIRELLGR